MTATATECRGHTKLYVWAALVALIVSFLIPPRALAQGGLALSGNFYRQSFRVPQGTSVSSPDIYVVVFNNGEAPFEVRITAAAPDGVTVLLDEPTFLLEAGAQRQMPVGVAVSEAVVPGEYEVSVTAEAQRETTQGVQLLGAAAQTARLVVTGEATLVRIRAVSPDGQAVPAELHFYRVAEDQRFELAFSKDGVIETKAAPGEYLAVAELHGETLGEETFTLSADEERTVEIVVHTLHIEGFGALPVTNDETGELAYARVVYTINNLAQPFPRAEAQLTVTHDGQPVEETVIATMAPLEEGRVGSNYNYMPASGWKGGTYTFQVSLLIEGEVATRSDAAEIVVPEGRGGRLALSNTTILIAIGGAIIVGLIIVVILLARRSKSTKTEA